MINIGGEDEYHCRYYMFPYANQGGSYNSTVNKALRHGEGPAVAWKLVALNIKSSCFEFRIFKHFIQIRFFLVI